MFDIKIFNEQLKNDNIKYNDILSNIKNTLININAIIEALDEINTFIDTSKKNLISEENNKKSDYEKLKEKYKKFIENIEKLKNLQNSLPEKLPYDYNDFEKTDEFNYSKLSEIFKDKDTNSFSNLKSQYISYCKSYLSNSIKCIPYSKDEYGGGKPRTRRKRSGKQSGKKSGKRKTKRCIKRRV